MFERVAKITVIAGGLITKNIIVKQKGTSFISTSQILLSVFFTDINNGYATSNNGTILKTTDGGISWTEQSTSSLCLYSIYFTNANNGFAVGYRYKTVDDGWGGTRVDYCGVILATTDGGLTWNERTNMISTIFYSVYFIDGNTGYVVGHYGKLLKTNDGGLSWNDISQFVYGSISYSVYFVDATNGYIASEAGKILRTTNAGNTWTIQYADGMSFRSVFFADINTGYIVGEKGVILKTSNGGTTWTKQISGTTERLNSVYFTDANTGYVVGSNGIILKTTDGGKTWYLLPKQTTEHLFALHFPNANTGFAVGNHGVFLNINNDFVPTLTLSTNNLSITSPANSTKTFDINSNTNWTVTSNQTWLTVSSATGTNNATITLTAALNPTAATRTATVTVSANGVTSQTITVTQDANNQILPPVAAAATNPSTSGSTANWQTSAGATGYQLDVATDNAFANMVTGFSNLDVLNTTSKSITGLSAGTTYYDRVRAYNTKSTSDNSNIITAQTNVAFTFAGAENVVYDAFYKEVTVATDPVDATYDLIYSQFDGTNWNDLDYMPPTDAGTYKLKVIASGTYIGVGESNTFTIAKASLTVKADNVTKLMSDPDPVFTYTFPVGFQGGDYELYVFGNNLKLTRASGETVGKYAITPSCSSPVVNYNVTYLTGELEIKPAKQLYAFTGATGSTANGSLVSDGTYLYGMTNNGGLLNKGVIFKIKTDGTSYTKLFDFDGAKGSNPYGSLLLINNVLYGMTYNGGLTNKGVIFKINTDGKAFTKLIDFDGTLKGSNPYGSLISDGTYLYGTTYTGGGYSKGVLFKITTAGVYTKLLDFDGISKGSNPKGSLVLTGGYLYGMTYYGGTVNMGTVFKVNTVGGAFAKILDFNGYTLPNAYGSYPFGSLVTDGTYLYGMTSIGGTKNKGVIFKINRVDAT